MVRFVTDGSGAAASGDEVLIGRAAVLSALVDLVDDGGGRWRAALVHGEPGIGKTELLVAAGHALRRRGVVTAYGRGDDLDRSRPFHLVEQLGRTLVGQDLPAGRRYGHEVADAFLSAVESAALASPVALLVDDLQWIDRDSGDALRRVRAELSDLPVSLIGGTRPADLGSALRVALEGALEVTLAPLGEDDIAELAGALVTAAPGPRLTAELARAGGNPFFAIQLLTALREHGRLVFGGGHVDLSDFALPDELRGVVLSRLDAHSADLATVLRTATVLGSEFDRGELQRLLGVRDLRALLTEAVAAGLLEQVELEGDRYAFRHDLLRAALYDELGPQEQPALHRRAAELLASLGAPSSRVASHLLLAPARPANGQVDLLVATAWDLRRHSAAASLELSQRGIRLVDERDHRRRRLLLGMVEPLVYLGRLSEAEAVAREVLAQADDLDPGLREELQFSLFISVARQDGAARAIADIDAVLAEPEGLSPTVLGVLHGCRAQALIQQGKAAEAAVHAERSLAIGEEVGDARLTVAAWLALAFVESAKGEVAEALRFGELALEHQHQDGMPFTADLYGGIVQLEADQLDAAADTFEHGRRRARDRGELSSQTTYDWALAGRHYLAGDWDDCLTEAEGGYGRMATGVGMLQAVLIGRATTTRILVHRGDLTAAEAEADRGTAELAAGALAGGDLLLWARSALLEARGDPVGALTLLEMELMMTEGVRYHLSWRLVFPELVRLAVQAGRDELVGRVVDLAEVGAMRAGDLASARGCALLCRGLADEDVDLVLQATAAYRRSPRIVGLARCAALAGTALAAREREVEALELLREAAEVYRGLGAVTDLAPIEATMQRLHGDVPSAPIRPSAGWESLTPSELKVVALVAEGHTTPQIAEALFVSANTVSTHLKHVFAKLGMSSRTEVAAEAVRRRERA